MIDTDLETNVKHIRPFLGTMLVISVGVLVYFVVHKSTEELVHSLHPSNAIDVEGSIALTRTDPVQYGGLISFSTGLSGAEHANAQQYITVICFQDDDVVYQSSAKPGVKFLLADPIEPGFDWDGGAASCNASFIYRLQGGPSELYMLDSVSFDVEART